jgi:RNA polymerase sigma-70 factor (ECF subfamily)
VEQEINCEEFGHAPGRGEAASYGLILAAQNGDRKAFQELVRDFEAIVMRVALNVTGSQEAAQEIYCQVFRDAFVSLNQLCSGSSVFIWIYRLLARRCVEYCWRHPGGMDTANPPTDLRSRLLAAIYALPPIERVILQLKHYQGLKIRTLAEIFNATPEFVIKNLRSANLHLRSQLKAASCAFSGPDGVDRDSTSLLRDLM